MEAVQTAYTGLNAAHRREAPRAFLQLTEGMIRDFLAYEEAEGKHAETVKCYSRCLKRLYDYLP